MHRAGCDWLSAFDPDFSVGFNNVVVRNLLSLNGCQNDLFIVVVIAEFKPKVFPITSSDNRRKEGAERNSAGGN